MFQSLAKTRKGFCFFENLDKRFLFMAMIDFVNFRLQKLSIHSV